MTKILSQGCMLVKAFLNFEPFCDSSGHNQILQISQKSPCHAMHAEYAIPFGKNKSLSCVLSKPTSTPQHVGVILGHGAGGDMHSGNLPLIAETLAREGFLCIRFTCSQTLVHANFYDQGARVASEMAHNNKTTDVAILGCVLFSYPLHTADNKDALRDKPLVDLACPLLFVRGSKDPMCVKHIFDTTLTSMCSPKVQIHTVEGGNHSLSVPGGKQKVQEAIEAALAAVCHFLNELAADVSVQPAASNSGSHKRTHPAVARVTEQETDIAQKPCSKKRTRTA